MCCQGLACSDFLEPCQAGRMRAAGKVVSVRPGSAWHSWPSTLAPSPFSNLISSLQLWGQPTPPLARSVLSRRCFQKVCSGPGPLQQGQGMSLCPWLALYPHWTLPHPYPLGGRALFTWRMQLAQLSHFSIYLYLVRAYHAFMVGSKFKRGRDFPGDPMIRTLHFHCRGHRFNPLSRNRYSTSFMMQTKIKKKKNYVAAHLRFAHLCAHYLV